MNSKFYTLTLNPAIDLVSSFNGKLQDNFVNRTNEEDYQANGKAINISYLLKDMNFNNKALGFLAGFTGDFINKSLLDAGIDTDFVFVDGITRINIFIHCEKEYKILNNGPTINAEKRNELIEKISNIEENSYLFVSGSNAKGLDDDIFIEISKICFKKNINLILDISSNKLLECLEYKPYLIKPNEEEIMKFINKTSLSSDDISEFCKNALNKGVKNIIVSLGENGSLYFSNEKQYKVSALKGEVINTACSGDTLTATFVACLLKDYDLEYSLKFASVAASLTAFSKWLCDINEVTKYIDDIEIINLLEV